MPDLSLIWSECGRILGDPNHDRWSTDILTTRANQAQREIQAYTNAVKTEANFTTTSGTAYVQLSTTTLDVLRVTKIFTDGSIRPLDGTTREELDFLYPDWNQWQSGEPLYWYFDTINGATNARLYMVPAPDANVPTLTVTYSRLPTDMSLSTDTAFDGNLLMSVHYWVIIHWVVGQCFMDDGTPEALTKSKFHRSGNMLNPGEYEKGLGRIMSQFDNASGAQSHILFRPKGGRTTNWYVPNKSNPLSWW